MNTGAFGEGFPYSNFHDLNMDWIIKIAKDFLDQYTHIQEVIANGEESLTNLTTSGLEQLQDKADALEELLQQWYNTHSEDIANQLADALQDLNNWYTVHQNYLDQYLTNSITAFGTAAETKAAETLETIPSDYSLLSAMVNNQEYNKMALYEYENNILLTHTPLTTGYMTMNGGVQDIYRGAYTPILTRQQIKNVIMDSSVSVRYAFFDANDTYVSSWYSPNIENVEFVKARAFFYPTRTGGTEDATDAEIILIHSTTKIISRNVLSNIPSEIEALQNNSVTRNEIDNNIKYTITTLTPGYMTLNGNTQDLYRGAYTPLLTFQQVKTAVTDPSIGVRYALYNENQEYIASYYNPLIEQDFAYAKAFFYPNRTGGNSEATEEEMNLILSTSKIVSREQLLVRPPYIIVAKDGSGDYTTINDAVDHATDGTTIFIKDGEYKETVVIQHYIHLVGESKYGTILYQNIGTYENAPLLITQGSVSNMTIFSKRPDSGEYDARAYAIHLDGIFASETKYQKCEIFNCIIRSEVHDAIGAGSNGQQVYDIHDNFIIVEQNAVTGACGLKLHNGRNQVSGIIKLANNIILSSKANGTSAYDILFHDSEPNVNPISLQMTNNVLKYYRNLNTSVFVPATYCYGNSVPAMNTL